jgi:hypothetical protein
MSGGAYALTLTLPADGLQVTAGEPVIGGLHAPELQHFHCGHCLSWVFTRPEGGPFVNLRAVMFDDADWFRPYADMCVDEKLQGVETGAVRAFSGFPDPSDYPALTAAYAERGARPA